MSRIEEIDKIVDEICDADTLFEFAEGVYEDRQRIAELEEQLKNVIVPKFKIGQEVWETIPFRSWKIKEIELKEVDGKLWEVYRLAHNNTDDYNCCIVPIDNDRFFATKAEALARLEELQGEKK